MNLNFSLIICTYMRAQPLLKLLQSIEKQSLYPNEILIIDGSENSETEIILNKNTFNYLKYYKVEDHNRGLTKQRNYGIKMISKSSNVVCFLDDDTILDTNYFKELISTYKENKDALAIGGYITNEISWSLSDDKNNKNFFYYDGWMRAEPSRFRMRRRFGLLPNVKPGYMPSFSNGRSISFLPPSGKIYQVEQIMGGASSYRRKVFNDFHFSNYFEGYGLYEDADFSLRLAKKGNLYINTNASLEHYHDKSGRPNQYNYGKMVVRNGWYVWRVKYPNPNFNSRFKWHAILFLLTAIRFSNVLTTNNRKQALTESFGRIIGWLSLFFNAPKSNTCFKDNDF